MEYLTTWFRNQTNNTLAVNRLPAGVLLLTVKALYIKAMQI